MNNDSVRLFSFAVDAMQNYLKEKWFQTENRLWTRKDIPDVKNKTLIEAFCLQSELDFGK